MQNKSLPKSLIARPVVLVLDAPAAPALELDALAGAGITAELIKWEGGAGKADIADLERADFIVTWRTPVDAAMIARAGRALLIAHYGPGAGRGVARVDLETARSAGIYVASVPDYATGSWAAETLRLMELICGQQQEKLGLVGYGQVGQAVAREARARKMEVWACDPFAPEEPFLTAGVRRAGLADLCGIADIISLHVPLGPATRGMIGAEQLRLMKREACLINTSDPELVDLDALAAGLGRCRPAAAAFDADLKEVLPPDHPLLTYQEAPLRHGQRRAGAAPEDAAACRRRVGELIRDVLLGRRPAHLLIDPPCPRHILRLARPDE